MIEKFSDDDVSNLVKLLTRRNKIQDQIDKAVSSFPVNNTRELGLFLYEYYKSTGEKKTLEEIAKLVGTTRVSMYMQQKRGTVTDRKLGFFQTPPSIVQSTMENPLFDTIRHSDWVLEPSAGHGAIMQGLLERLDQQIVHFHCCEISTSRQAVLQSKGFYIVCDDFLKYNPQEKYQAIVMNPPFFLKGDRYAYIAHILHAWDVLAEKGFLISLAPHRKKPDKVEKYFQSFVQAYGTSEMLSDKCFHESGTDIDIDRITLVKC